MHHIIFRVCLTNDIYRYTGVNKRNTSIRALNCLHISVMLHQRQGNSPRWSISDEFNLRMVKPTKSNVIAIELSPSCRAGGNFRVNGQYWVHQSRTDCDTYSTEHGLHRTAYTGNGRCWACLQWYWMNSDYHTWLFPPGHGLLARTQPDTINIYWYRHRPITEKSNRKSHWLDNICQCDLLTVEEGDGSSVGSLSPTVKQHHNTV